MKEKPVGRGSAAEGAELAGKSGSMKRRQMEERSEPIGWESALPGLLPRSPPCVYIILPLPVGWLVSYFSQSLGGYVTHEISIQT